MVEYNFLEFLNRTGKIRVVIGNGFDLYCGLHTTYSNYYCKYWKKYKTIQSAIGNSITNNIPIEFSDETLKTCNIWDVFFAMHSSEDPEKCQHKWCEVEKLILKSLLTVSEEAKETEVSLGGTKEIDDSSSSGGSIYRFIVGQQRTKVDKLIEDEHVKVKIRWPELKRYISGKLATNTGYEKVMVEFVQYRMKQKSFSLMNYYEFILDELNDFEKTFGDFVNSQIVDNSIHYSVNKIYINKVNDLLNLLCPPDSEKVFINEIPRHEIYIDSFNYPIRRCARC